MPVNLRRVLLWIAAGGVALAVLLWYLMLQG